MYKIGFQDNLLDISIHFILSVCHLFLLEMPQFTSFGRAAKNAHIHNHIQPALLPTLCLIRFVT